MNGIELTERLRAGVPVYALGIRASRTTDVVRWAKAAGYDTIWIDMEHSTLRSGVNTTWPTRIMSVALLFIAGGVRGLRLCNASTNRVDAHSVSLSNRMHCGWSTRT